MISYVPNANELEIVPQRNSVTTSSTYVNFPEPSVITFTKFRTDTKLIMRVLATGFATAINDQSGWGIRINSVDYNFGNTWWNVANKHREVSGLNQITSLAAGAYTAQLRWRRNGGVGNISVDANDRLFMSVTETF